MKDYAKFLFVSKRNKRVYLVNSRFNLTEDDIEVLYPNLYKQLKKDTKKINKLLIGE